MNEGPPFFVVGSARSGTTLLRMMLNSHPDVAVPPESRFVVELAPRTSEVEATDFLAALGSHARFRLWDVPVEAVRAEIGDRDVLPYADALSAAYRAYARAQGKTRWGDKTPRYVEAMPFISSLWPDARFVHLIRDGRDVALSYGRASFGPRTVAKAAALWARRVEEGRRAGRDLGPTRYLEMRYEDLTANPRGAAGALCAFLDLAFDPAMLEPDGSTHALDRAQRDNPLVTRAPVARAPAWVSDMRPRHQEVFEAIAGGLLSELGYPRRYEAPGTRVRLLALLGGAGLPVGRLPGATGVRQGVR